MRLPAFVCLSVCLSACLLARLFENACMDLNEMLRVDRCRDMDELINFSARSGLQSGCRNRIAATRNFITSGKSHVQVLGARHCSDAWFQNGFIHREPWEQLCRRYVRSTECTSSLTLKISCPLKSGLGVTRGHWKWYHSKAFVRFPLRVLQ